MDVNKLGGLGIAAPQSRNKNAIDSTNKRLNDVLEQLASGKRINRASDDAAGLSLSEQLNTQIRGFKMADRNVQDAMSALNISDGVTSQVASLVQRQRELAGQARNGTVNDDQRKILNQEFQQINEEIDRIAEKTEFNKQKLANGSQLGGGTAEVQVGANPGESMALPTVDMRGSTLGISGADISSVAGAEAAMSLMDVAIDNINSQRSTIGAMTNRLSSTANTLATAQVNTEAADSLIRDQDMAMGLAELAKQQILNRTGTQAFGMFNKISSDHIMGLLQ